MLTDQQIEMLSDEQLNAKRIRLGRRWCRWPFGSSDLQKREKFVELNKRLNRLDKEYLKRREKC